MRNLPVKSRNVELFGDWSIELFSVSIITFFGMVNMVEMEKLVIWKIIKLISSSSAVILTAGPTCLELTDWFNRPAALTACPWNSLRRQSRSLAATLWVHGTELLMFSLDWLGLEPQGSGDAAVTQRLVRAKFLFSERLQKSKTWEVFLL